MKIIVDAFGGLVCDRSQCEIKGVKRVGSGQNFETHFCVYKILGTATGRT